MAAHEEKPLNELLSRDMVDIYVGPQNTHWILHEKLLCHRSKFFRNIFNSKEKKEGKDQSFGLPDDEDEPFRLFIGWLYSSAVPTPREEKDLGNLFELYLMSEKWAINGLTKDSLEAVRNFYKDTDSYPALRRVQYIYANSEQDSPMRQLLIGSVARMLVLRDDGMPPQWDKALRKNGQLAVDIMLAMQKWKLEEASVPDARKDSVVPIMEDSQQAKDSRGDNDDAEEGQEEEDDQDEDQEENDDEERGENEQEDDEEEQDQEGDDAEQSEQ